MGLMKETSQFHTQAGVLRFITAGSVDDGKSTLIGRLLHDSRSIFEDQLLAVEKATLRRGQSQIDLSLLTDGLEAEREQGITIDVAYRYFSTPRRKFIIADTPGHEQYTRNMVTGASTADAAIILIDARKGVLTQTRRHTYITHLLGVRHVIVAINKMDLVSYDQKVFDRIRDEFINFSKNIDLGKLSFIPLSALRGDQVVEKGVAMPWYQGKTLLSTLEDIDVINNTLAYPMRFPVQLVVRTGAGNDFRGYAGRLASGVLHPHDEVLVLPSKRKSRIKEILSWDQSQPNAQAGDSVTLVLTDEIDISRGDMVCQLDSPPHLIKKFQARICWMSETALKNANRFLIKHTSKTVKAKINNIIDRLDINTLINHSQPDSLVMNDIARVSILLSQPLLADLYKNNRETGAFIIIDEVNHQTVAVGMIEQWDEGAN